MKLLKSAEQLIWDLGLDPASWLASEMRTREFDYKRKYVGGQQFLQANARMDIVPVPPDNNYTWRCEYCKTHHPATAFKCSQCGAHR